MTGARRRSRCVLALASLVVVGMTATACGSSSSSTTDTATTGARAGSPSAGAAGSATEGGDAAVQALVPPELASKGSITFAASAAHPPNAFFDDQNKLTGWEVELGTALAKKMGLKPDFQKVQFAAIIPGLQSGRYDVGLSGISDNKKRQEVVNFVDYFSAGTSLVVKAGNPEKLKTIPDLCGHKVAIETGTSQVDFATGQSAKCTAAGKKPIEVATFPDETQVLLQIRTGRATAGLNDFPVAAYLAQQSNGDLEAVRGTGEFSAPYGLAVPKGSDGLTNALQAALKAVIADGTYEQILKKWNLQDGALTTATINGATE